MSVSFGGSKALAVGMSVYLTEGDWLRGTVNGIRSSADGDIASVRLDNGRTVDVEACTLVKRDASVTLRYPEPDQYGDDRRDFNMSNMNARAFLQFLQVPSAENEDGLCGSMPMGDMMRLVQKAQASFDYRVDALCREGFDKQGKRGPRVIMGGIGPDYFERRLAEFAEYLTDLSLAGASEVTWG